MKSQANCIFALLALLLHPACSSRTLDAAESATRPNIIVIMSDDMGYSDLGCYGGDARTPNLDSLAAGGVRFTQFYNTARCCPTRASLLTGLYPHQAGIGHMTNDRGLDGYRGTLNNSSVTIAEVLRPAGYRTYMCGKWHVTSQVDANGDQSNWPVQRGFDKYYGTLNGAGNFFRPRSLCRQNALISSTSDPDYQPEQYYYTDALSDNAVKFLQQHQAESPSQPFFLYVAYTAAHWPMQAQEKDIAKYKGKFDDGYSPHRQARLARMKELGLIPDGLQLSAPAEDWSQVKNVEWEARCMEVYSAMIDNMDAGIGRILGQLKSAGKFDNTLVLFLQDNGGCAEALGRAETAPNARTANGERSGPGVMPGPEDTFIAYGRGWANVSNTPFREYKHWVHEGGISTPLIAHWPVGIPAERSGQLEQQPGHLIDIMATCVDLSGAPYPTTVAGRSIKPREGVSLRPAFTGQSVARSGPLFWEHEGNRAVRDGKWKLVAKENAPWELYDIEADRIEANDLSSARPELVNDLATKWETYAARANVLPLGGWKGKLATDAKENAARRFELKAGEKLNRADAPAIARRGIRVTAKVRVSSPDQSGVIVADGGSAQGFSLYLQAGKPVFFVRSSEGDASITGSKPLSGEHTLEARLSSKGILNLKVDGQAAAEEVAGHLISKKPTDGLQVGRDEGGAVGQYRSPNAFAGTIESVAIELEEESAEAK